MTLHIKDWDTAFENYRTREIRGPLDYVLLPTLTHSESFKELLKTVPGITAFGVFIVLVEIAGRTPTRGVLADEKGDFNAKRIATRTGMPAKTIEAALNLLKSAEIGWIFDVPLPDRYGVGDKPVTDQIGELDQILDLERNGSGQDATTAATADAAPLEWSRSGGWQGITAGHRELWARAYPACNINVQLAKAEAWLIANPAKAKKSNWLKFMTNWLSRSQDRGGDTRSNAIDRNAPTPVNVPPIPGGVQRW